MTHILLKHNLENWTILFLEAVLCRFLLFPKDDKKAEMTHQIRFSGIKISLF